VKKKSFQMMIGFALAVAGGCARAPVHGAAPVPVLAVTAVATNVPVQIDPPPVGHVTPISTVTVH